MSTLLQAGGLRRRFGGLWAADGIDLDIAPGEIHALIGPNGAGKTTLIHLISGALQPEAGTLRFAGENILPLAMHERASRGIVRSFQITQIFPNLSLLENVRLAAQSRRPGWKSFHCWHPASADFHLIEEAERWLGYVGLIEAAACLAGDVSHGEQRALELAMTLATRPQLLLLDEPMAGMGPEESGHIADLIKSFRGEHTILLVEHDLDIVFRLADRISVLVAGKILVTGSPDKVRQHPEVRQAYLGEESA